MVFAVTGSTGPFGSLVIQHLLSLKVPAGSIVALARDEAKAAALKAKGVQVRIADYNEPETVQNALKGVDRLVLVSGNEFGQRVAQHQTVVNAAKSAGVKLVVYTSIAQADTTSNPLAPEHKATEGLIRQSGVPYVFLRNNWYTENYADDLRYAKASGIIASSAVSGRVASASREDYAEAAARVAQGEGHANKIYELTGPAAWNFEEFAQAASDVLGRPVNFQKLSVEDRKKGLAAAGLPDHVVGLVVSLDQTTEAGTLKHVSGDLAKILGRSPRSLKEGLKLISV